jgi:hypothetical protein
MKLVIKDKEYAVCDNCGAFKSNERCYNCHPLTAGDLDVCDQLRKYYGIPTKPGQELPGKWSRSNLNIENDCDYGKKKTGQLDARENSYFDALCGKNLSNWTFRDPKQKTKHHLLEYYFSSEHLKEMGLYYNVPDWQLLEITQFNHHRRINGLKLHTHKLDKDWEKYKQINETKIRELINNIPKEIIETFSNK